MIVDHLSNASKYFSVHPKFTEAFQYIKQLQITGAQPGSYEAEPGVIFGSIQDSVTVAPEQAKFEGHYKYIDIQMVLKGTMDIYVTAADRLMVSEVFTPNRDLLYFKKPDIWTTLCLSDGDFAILYPGEAHAPAVAHENSTPVCKLVLKVLAQM